MAGETKKRSKDWLFLTKIVAVTALAFCAALAFRRSAGILAMTPVSFLLCAVSAFIGIQPVLKYVIFGVTVFSVNTIEQSDMRVTLTFTALCILACLLFEGVAHLIRNKKRASYALLPVALAVCMVISILTVGNPFTAYTASNTISEYTDYVYPEEGVTGLGDFEFGRVYYVPDTGVYAVDAVSTRYPTEGERITFDGEHISDSFMPIMETKLQDPYVLEFTTFLRERFPNSGFEVKCVGIAKMPDSNIFTDAGNGLGNSLYFEITIGGIQTATAMLECVDEYVTAIDRAGLDYAGITFKSGIGQWFRRSVSVDGTRPEFIDAYTLERVHTATDGVFQRYASRFFVVE